MPSNSWPDTALQMQGRRPSKGQESRPDIGPSSHVVDPTCQVTSSPTPPPPDTRRTRLPPRSRSGCWTCRTRKVKCDEKKPECGECLRLGHVCDYNPRLSFKDDTPRTVQRMRETFLVGNSVFDGFSPITNLRRGSSTEDSLPPLATLTTDEEREKKAESQVPGTYHVIVNPSTFASLDEYREDATMLHRRPSLSLRSNIDRRKSIAAEVTDGSAIEDSEDPNTVILRRFDDPVRKASSQAQIKLEKASTSHASPRGSFSHSVRTGLLLSSSSGEITTVDIVRQGGRDGTLLQHYRTAISPYIFRNGRQQTGEDIFEIQARTYPPLYHAIMALAAHSLAFRNGVQSADALEHYQQVIPALKRAVQSSQDSYSDGALFTHFILLLYEISATGNQESNMWQHHSNQLLRIVTLRRQMLPTEPYDFVVWMVFTIDIYALLSTSGSGDFAEMLRGSLPLPEACFPPSISGSHSPAQDEWSYFPAAMKLNQEVHVLALQVGRLARDLRNEAKMRGSEPSSLTFLGQIITTDRTARIQGLHRELRQAQASWMERFQGYTTWLSGPEMPPPRMFDVIMQAYVLYRALIIYAHTSLYPTQLSDPLPDFDNDITSCVEEIIQASQIVLSQERFEIRYITFPLFIAGIASQDQSVKSTVLGLLQKTQTYGAGERDNGRKTLEAVFERQRRGELVDWVGVKEEICGQLIIYG